MANHVIRLRCTDIGTLDLYTSGYMVTEYAQRTARAGEETVTETLSVLVVGSSVSDMQGKKTAIERYLFRANLRNDPHSPQYQTGERIYISAQPDSESREWRSEILAASMEADKEALRSWASFKQVVRLYITRRYYWEDNAENAVTLANNNGSSSSGLTLYNHEDGGSGHDNWATILAAAIVGDLPAPAKVTWKNTSGAARAYRQFYFWNNAYASPDYLWFPLEAENAIGSYGGSSTADAGCSNGYKWALNFTGTGSIRILLTAGTLGYIGNRPLHIITRWASFDSNVIYAKAEIYEPSGLVSLTPWMQERLLDSSAYLQDLGTLQPSLRGNQNAALQLSISLRASGSKSVALDFIHMAGPDSFRYISLPNITPPGFSIENNETLIDDGIEEQASTLNASGESFPVVIPYGKPLMLFPNVNQRIGVLVGGVASSIDHTSTLKIVYRPRKAVL